MSLKSFYTYSSLLSMLALSFHYTDDVIRGENADGGAGALIAALIMVVWLFGVLVLSERKAGYIIGLVGSIMPAFVAVAHLTGLEPDGTLAAILIASGPFFVWTVFALGVTGFSALISAVILLVRPPAQKPAAG